jgi:hypothetical protein
MIREVYEALKEAGATEEKAAAAAEAIEEVRETERLQWVEERVGNIQKSLARLDERVAGRFTLLQWMLGVLLALGVANLSAVVVIALRLVK